MHYRLMFPHDYLCAADLQGKEHKVTIDSVSLQDLQGDDGKKQKKPIVKFVGKEKGMVLNKTNARFIAKLYGPLTDEWTGKQITIYGTTCKAFGETVECVRVK